MTSTQNQALKALPNVLHDQTVPNVLGGVGPPRRAARRRVPARTLLIAVGVVVVALVAVLARTA